MKERIGSLWSFHADRRWIVIPTNIGWNKAGHAIMGSGVARVVSDMYPQLAAWYGARCKKYGADTGVAPYYDNQLLLFPTKPLNEEKPWISWKSDSDLLLVQRSINQLVAVVDYMRDKKKIFISEIGLPLVGCGCGNLDKRVVKGMLSRSLDDRFILFEIE